jgi:hypothetical protein
MPSRAVPTFVYDGQDQPACLSHLATERGPPSTHDHTTTAYDADGVPPPGASACSGIPITPATYDYDNLARLDEAAHGSRDYPGQRSDPAPGRAVAKRLHVAAKSADEALTGVDEVLGGLSKGRSSGVRTVGSDAELDDVYGTLTRGGTPVDVPGYKGTWIERSDGVRVGLRDASKSGGRTIDIRYPDGTTGKIHIE